MSEPIKNRYEFVLLFDVKDGNPNGDPDAGNLPRIDPETGHGLVTDVCLKRKVRNYVGLVEGNLPPYEIYVKEKAVLNLQHARAFVESKEVREALAAWKLWMEDKKNNKKPSQPLEDVAQRWVCENFFDVRTFGAVMSTSDKVSDGEKSKIKKRAGQVRGPVQMTFARSKHPIFSAEHSLTVCAARKADEPIEAQIGIQGRKFTVPYALYETHGYISAPLARQTGFSEKDLKLFWDALLNMFDHDRSAARGEMAPRKLIVFKHSSALGNAPAQKLFDLVTVEKNCGDSPPRSFSDYTVSIDRDRKPDGVEIIEML